MQRRAFTILEVLIVIVVIAVLLGLLVPAVQYARESARRTDCISHLAQLGRAMHGYESTHRRLPASRMVKSAGNLDEIAGTPHVQLLPWLDQSDLFESLSPSERRRSPLQSNRSAPVNLPVFRCPTDSGGGSSNYAWCTGWSVTTLAVDHPDRAGAFCTVCGGTQLSEVTDGLSNTAAASERLTGSWDTGSFDRRRDMAWSGLELLVSQRDLTAEILRTTCLELQPSTDFNPYTGRSWLHGSYLGCWYNHAFPPNPDFPPCAAHQPLPLGAAPFYGPSSGIFSATSDHPGCVNVLLLDGSVRAVSDSVGTDAWRAVGTSAGSEVVTEF